MGYTAPSVEGQAEVIAEALAVAGRRRRRRIAYIEAHGTGTALGDPIEIQALDQGVPRRHRRSRASAALGSVKTNIGHLDVAAGVAGLIKTVLALQHGEIPPSLHFERPNPRDRLRRQPGLRQHASWRSGSATARPAGPGSARSASAAPTPT